jgi:hypothetical protein
MGIVAAVIAGLLDPINWALAFLVFWCTRSSEKKFPFLAFWILLSTAAWTLISYGIVQYSIYGDNEIDYSFNTFDEAHVSQMGDLDMDEFLYVFNEKTFQARKLYLEARDRDCRIIWDAFLNKHDSDDIVKRVCAIGGAAVTATSQLALVGAVIGLAGTIARRRVRT